MIRRREGKEREGERKKKLNTIMKNRGKGKRKEKKREEERNRVHTNTLQSQPSLCLWSSDLCFRSNDHDSQTTLQPSTPQLYSKKGRGGVERKRERERKKRAIKREGEG